MPTNLSWLNDILLGLILPSVLAIGGAKLLEFMEKAYKENPDLVRTTVVSLYPFIDVYVEKYAAESKTKYDDKAVAELMRTVETFAGLHQITLPNLDND
jgi:hypothetical protein